MVSTNAMIIGVQGPEGSIKLKISETDTFSHIIKKIEESYPNLPVVYRLWRDPRKDEEILLSGMKHNFEFGDRIYVEFVQPRMIVTEDDVDKTIENNPGIINVEKTKECNHANEVKCLKCCPIRVHESAYLDKIEPPLKYMSFHVFMRRLLDGCNNKNNFQLDEIRCKLTPGCTNHQPYPAGICTKCQPPCLTLKHQEFRHVDNIMFEGHEDVDVFIGFWRRSMCQRIGYLYGKYEVLDNIPLGIRASVHCIYEPPQNNTFCSIKLLDDPFENDFNTCAQALGYKKVGWILTDLLIDPQEKGNVMETRSASTYHLSAQECITAAHFQNLHPNICKYSPSGVFGSKFVTVVVTGNDKGQIDFHGWQVSNQCMALVRDSCLVPTVDEPALAYVRESSHSQYVPDVFYQDEDEYKNKITKLARPVPVEYFLVDVPTGFPLNPTIQPKSSPFPVANRNELGVFQTFNGFEDFINDPISSLKDLHLISFLYSKLEPDLKEHLIDICRYFSLNDHESLEAAISDYKFSNIITFIRLNQAVKSNESSMNQSNPQNSFPSPDQSSNRTVDQDNSMAPWACPVCTYENLIPTHDDEGFLCCEMCRIPK
ncbi:Nuclear protein localization protein 4 [Thelohanellus kitauei]|uniref:Nuclear protein localization protein 4 n=1 Tax=Thelohanellus kitauei TaxID=669202 RepID=A0A0C2IY33_THEKT|nr:Nuclear protein localization protein 4 [Thelohanellus kitauei]